MKKFVSKKIILSVLLGSMMWSNSLYAYTLTGYITEDDIKQNENFETNESTLIEQTPIYELKNNEELIISKVDTTLSFANVVKVEDSKNIEKIYGGFIDNACNNELEIVNSTVDSVTASTGYNDVNDNTLILNNANVKKSIYGALAQGEIGEIVDSMSANRNKVFLDDGDFKVINGGNVGLIMSLAYDAEANNNLVEIKNFGKKEQYKEAYDITGGGVLSALVSGDKNTKWDASNNHIKIDNSYFNIGINKNDNAVNTAVGIVGGLVQSAMAESFTGIASANNNIVEIKNSSIDVNNGVYGMIGGYVTEISIDNFNGLTEASGNTINIDNSTINGLVIGGRNDKGQAIDNHVVISNNSTLIGDVIGGYTEAYAAVANSVEINGSNNLKDANLYGYKGITTIPTLTSDNSIKINGFNGNINSVNNFDNMTFSNIEWKDKGIVVDAQTTSNLSDATFTLNSNNGIKFNAEEINAGESMTLLHSGNELGTITDLQGGKEFNTTAGVVAEIKGIIEQTDANNVVMSVKDIKLADQTMLVAENRAVAAAFVNQGTDLIADSLDTLSRDGKYGVKTFAAVHGNRSKYDVNSDIKINGWSTIVGVGSETEHNGGDFSWGVFYENGSGNYRTFNSFNNEYFRGDGSLVYNGGGIAARYENAHGVYTEGSLRAGMLKSDMDNALSDGENKYGYSSESEYYGAHIGIGQIIPLSESSDLDVYGKFFHTYTEGDSFKVDTDEFEFDSINSDRLRVGARLTTNKENKFSTYYGLAYEYEFNGDAEMRAAGMSAPEQSLQGSSYMAEIGLNYQPTPDSPWSFDINMRGYAGEREGATFNVQATYTF